MIIVENLTPQRMAQILSFPVTYDEDCPELTDEQLARLRPKYPENFGHPKDRHSKTSRHITTAIT
jgi:hypothetical protein